MAGVVVFPDAFGLRDTMREMGDRLASLGYVALVPDVFYRAGDIGDKIAAAASFHAGRVAIGDDPASPHLAADRIRAAVDVAGSIEDPGFTSDHVELLDQAPTSAGAEHTIEFYPGHHGFAVPDNPRYDQALADRHWEALRKFYAERLS